MTDLDRNHTSWCPLCESLQDFAGDQCIHCYKAAGMTDLDRLETLRDNATQGEWRATGDGSSALVTSQYGPVAWISNRYGADDGEVTAVADAEYIAALHNADLIGRVRELEAREAKVREFINLRPEYVAALKNSRGSSDNDADYWRWSGGAEARRQLANSLGWSVPHEFGEKTAILDGTGN